MLCGLLAAQVSTITSDINSVATLFTSDVYRNLRKAEPTQKQLLIVVRLSSLICGGVMLLAALGTRAVGVGAVRANLTIVGIFDMPLFVITIVYGLCWRRTNWQGATAGFIAGGTAGVLCYLLVKPEFYKAYRIFSIAPIVSTATALIVTPIVTLMFPKADSDSHARIWKASEVEGDTGPDAHPIDGEVDTFHLIPTSLRGRIGMGLAIAGFLAFLTGVSGAHWAWSMASAVAVGGMVCVFAGRIAARVYTE